MGAGTVVSVAEVVKAVGLKGEIKIYPLLDWWDPFLEHDVLVWEDGSPVEVTGWREQPPCRIVKIAGTDDRNAAEDLVGREIGFLRSRYSEPGFPKPPGGLPFRWLGRAVRTTDGEVLGEVDEVRFHGSQFTLVVPRAGCEVLIPALPPILVDEEGLDGPLIVDLPEGLLDVALG